MQLDNTPSCKHFPRCPGTCVDVGTAEQLIADARLFAALHPEYYTGTVHEHQLVRAGIRMAEHILNSFGGTPPCQTSSLPSSS